MCGIAGVIDLEELRPVDAEVLDRMVDRLHLRGPDDRGTSIRRPVAMGMRRLSIIDVEGGSQPMTNADGTIRVVMNGELYSFPEIRAELIARGHCFRTRSDTEVLVHGYQEWGLPGLLARLNGMFAFALQDERRRRCYLVRDRLGIKPLLYTVRNGRLVFGSAMSALLESGLVPIQPDPTGLRLYLHNQFIPGSHTAIAGVRKLPPATYLEIAGGEVKGPVRYWQLPRESDESRPMADWADETRALLTDAVRVHMISDVEVGVFLSGGLDSSTVLGLMEKFAGHPVKAFSIGFEDRRRYDELPFAKLAAERFGADLQQTVFTPDHVAELALELVHHLEEPLGDPACLPTFLLAKQARERVKVVLSGEGADELFAGYDYYKHLPPTQAGFRRNFAVDRAQGLLSRLVHGRVSGRIRVTGTLGMVSPHSGFPYAMSPDYVELLLPDLPADGMSSVRQAQEALERSYLCGGQGSNPLATALLVDAQGWLPEDLLMKVDRTTMAHSLEARVPFLDYRVAELAFRMPSTLKLRDGQGKAVLREAFGELLGPELTSRKKHGFDLPMHLWVRNQLRPLIEGRLRGHGLHNSPWLCPDAVAALLDAHAHGRASLERPIWNLFVLVSYFEEMRRSHAHAAAG